MQNINLSENVKKYFVNALKGIGWVHPNNLNQEATTQQIISFLNDSSTTLDSLHNGIKYAVVRRLQNDALLGNNFLQNETSYDRKTIKNILQSSSSNFNNQNCDTLLRCLVASGIDENGQVSNYSSWRGLDNIVYETINVLQCGVFTQSSLSDTEQHEAAEMWQRVACTNFKDYLTNVRGTQGNAPYRLYQGQFNYNDNDFEAWIQDPNNANLGVYNQLHNEFMYRNVRKDLIEEVSRLCFNQNVNITNQFLDTKIQDNRLLQRDIWHRLSANEKLLEGSYRCCQMRYEAQGMSAKDAAVLAKRNDSLTFFDVLAAAGDSKAQILTFFQTRSQEQQEAYRNDPAKSEVKKENKIGNLIGAVGRKLLKDNTGKDVIVDYDKPADLKSGKKCAPRGFKKLLEKIAGYMSGLWNNVPSIGLIQEIMAKAGFDFDGEPKKKEKTNQIKKEPWRTDFQTMPDEYHDPRFKMAKDYYNKTKARILADKTKFFMYQAENRNAPQQEEINLPKMNYLHQRIIKANEILEQLNQQIDSLSDPQRDPNDAKYIQELQTVQDQQYYLNLEEEILAEQVNQNHPELQDEINDGKKADNVQMSIVMRNLLDSSSSSSPDVIKTKRDIAIEIFNLRSKCQANEITNEYLDQMIERFVNGDDWRRIYFELNPINPLNALSPISADDAMKQINDFVEKDLKSLTQYRGQIASATVEEALL